VPQTAKFGEGCKTDPEPDMDSGRAGVRNMRSKCRCSYVLQFTFRRAVCCVLHRPPSQVIHCAVLSLQTKAIVTTKRELANIQQLEKHFQHGGELRLTTEGEAKLFEQFKHCTSTQGPRGKTEETLTAPTLTPLREQSKDRQAFDPARQTFA
jgi:hypothetical protein